MSAGLACATAVPDKLHPRGHAQTPPNRTPLQQHLDYFDLDKNGIITPAECFRALRMLRVAWEPFNTILAAVMALALHICFSYPTQGSWFPSPWHPIHTCNAHKLVYGSSSKAFDHEGRYIPERFEELFSK